MKWCSDRGLPHSELLGWAEDDRAKQVAFLLVDAQRCSQCGTSQWEWDEDRFAYEPALHLCHGCFLLDASAQDQTDATPGSRMVLVPKAIAREREAAPSVPPGKRSQA